MEKWQKTLAATIAASIALSCFLAGCKKSESSKDTTKKTGKTTSVSETEEPTDTEPSETSDTSIDLSEFQFTEDNYPVLDGSTSTKPLATAVTSIMLGIPRSEADKKLEFHKTSQSFRYLMDGNADMLICAQPADSVFELMEEENFEYEMEAFSAEALVFVVNTSNPVESLTTEQIQKIYTGEITNWKEVGGEDKEIVAVQRNKEAGSQVMMEKLVMGDLEMMEAPLELMPGDMSGLIQVVKSFDNSAGAIGYTPYYYATNMKMADGLKIIKVDDVMPDNETIASGEYPFRTSYFVVIPKSTPDDAPSRILFNWILGEDGQKLVEMEGYVPAASSSVPKNTVEVVADWTVYQPAEAADSVFTRLKDEEIADFIPSSDYGRIYPFTGSLKEGYWSWSTKRGFFDQNGRIICDPVYDSIWALNSDMYIVYQYAVTDDPSEQEKFIGVISSDGSHYTGMKYCDYILHSDGSISLVEKTSDGIKVYPYGSADGSVGSPRSYKMTTDGVNIFTFLSLNKIIDDRYLVFYDDEGCDVTVYDGTTGNKVSFGDNTGITDCCGEILVGYDISGDFSGTKLFDIHGNEIKKQIDYVTSLDDDTILFYLPDGSGWEIADANGNEIKTLTDLNHEINEFHRKPDCFVAMKSDSVEIYDLHLNLTKTVKLKGAYNYSLASAENENYFYRFSDSFKTDLYAYHISNGKTSIINLNTEESTTIDGAYGVCVLPDRLLLSTYDYGDENMKKWLLLDAKDYHKITEGEGETNVYEDMKDHTYYMAVGKEFWSDTLSIVDIATGEVVWESLPNPRSDVLFVDSIYDGKLIYTTNHNYSSYEVACSSTNMIDKDGNVIFLFNTVYLPGD